MRIRLRLAKLLGVAPYGKASVTKLAAEMGISRHQLLHTLDENSKHINRQVLESVCNYLIEKKKIPPDDLLHALFALEPHQFWSMMKSCDNVLLTLGVRWDAAWDDHVVVAADSMLHSELIKALTDPRRDGRLARAAAPPSGQAASDTHPTPHIQSKLVTSWVARESTTEATITEARSIMSKHLHADEPAALICIGSVKSNPVAELVLAHLFPKARAFTPEDDVAKPDDRSCPFAFVYRDRDVHCPSCWAGEKLHRFDRAAEPGIYHETDDGIWDRIPWNKDTCDGGLVAYRYDRMQRKLEMIIGGFTGRATRCLAEMINTSAVENFWPPSVRAATLDIGVFIVPLRARPSGPDPAEPFFRRLQPTSPIRLSAEVINRRLGR